MRWGVFIFAALLALLGSSGAVYATGACCADNGTCTEVTEVDCLAASGTYQGDGTTCGTVECPVLLTPFMDPLPIPVAATPASGTPGGVATYNLAIKEFTQQLHSELPPTRVWGFGDGFAPPSYPGPTVEAASGDTITLNWINDLRDLSTGDLRASHYLDVDTDCIEGAEDNAKTVVHLHGGHVEAAADGFPEATFLPGNSTTYTYSNIQQAAPLWYHDHSMGITRLNVYMGLAGYYLIRDDVEDALDLPTGEYEVPLALQDRKFNPDGSLQYPSMWMDHFFGDKILVNGKVWPYLQVKQGKYRFRVLNGSGSRVYTLSLLPPSGSLSFTVIGTDGGLLAAPVAGVSTLTIGPGERYDVIVDFAGYAAGDEILLQNSAPAPYPGGVVDQAQVMKFTVTAAAGFTNAIPGSLRPVVPLNPADSRITRDFVLKKTGSNNCGQTYWEINNLGWMDVTEFPRLNTVEIWRFVNDSSVSHPMHMHLVMFQILNRNTFSYGPGGVIVPGGSPAPPAAHEAGWKDTVMVNPGEMVSVIARFETYKGQYVYHCHILEHEDNQMMRQFQTIQCGDNVLDPTEECDNGAPGTNLCSLDCEIEDFMELYGTAKTGRVEVTIDGVVVGVDTVLGQTAEQVILALVAAVLADPDLQTLNVTARAEGNRLITNGDITNVFINAAQLCTVPAIFCDDFEDGLMAGDWYYDKPIWSETGGALAAAPGKSKTWTHAIPAFAGCSSCSVEATLESAGGEGNRLWLLGWLVDKKNTVELLMKEESDRWILRERVNGKIMSKSKAVRAIEPGVSYRAKITFDGADFQVFIDGDPVITLTATAAHSGTVGFQARSTTASFGEIIVN